MLIEALNYLKSKKLFSEKDGITLCVENKSEDSNVMLMSGDNASGKSIVCRLIKDIAKKESCNVRETSMGDRAKKGYMQQAITYGRYGDENKESTGNLTAKRIIKDVEFLENYEQNFLMIVDEPEMGLGKDYHKALGQFLAKACERLHETGRCKGFIICSHSKTMFKSFLYHTNFDLIKLRLGEGNEESFCKWISNESKGKTMEDFINLPNKASERRKSIGKYLKD